MAKGGDFQIRRVYEAAEPDDGTRVLVDRMWPRGLAKRNAVLDMWLKDVTPSNELRRWYHQDSTRFEEFQERYRRELAEPAAREAARQLRAVATEGRVTLLTASKDVEHSHVPTLAHHLASSSAGARARRR